MSSDAPVTDAAATAAEAQTKLAKQRARLARVLNELYTTEWDYVNNMRTLVSVYINVLTPAAKSASKSPSRPPVRGRHGIATVKASSSTAPNNNNNSRQRARTRSGQQLLDACGFEPDLLTPAESRAIFRDIESLMAIDETLLGDLEIRFQSQEDHDRYRVHVGDILVQFAPHLKM